MNGQATLAAPRLGSEKSVGRAKTKRKLTKNLRSCASNRDLTTLTMAWHWARGVGRKILKKKKAGTALNPAQNA